MLELLPQAETAPMNPLVVAALRRIERAHSRSTGNGAAATALAYEEQPTLDLNPPIPDTTINEPIPKPERVHNLAVVPTVENLPVVPAAEDSDFGPAEDLAVVMTVENVAVVPTVEDFAVDTPADNLAVVPTIKVETAAASKPARKPIRVIDDRNQPCLNYLDSIPTSIRVETHARDSAPVFRRLLSAFADLLLVASPFLALTRLTNVQWQNPRTIGFAAAAFMVIGFLYLTVSVAFTGRTLGMKLLSLRVIDARTGLIPTGGQSAGRSLVYLLSLASAGIALMYLFVNHEKHTVHDRFTRTAVVRA
jgi:uncharacterized RDD family membrane protein YckC